VHDDLDRAHPWLASGGGALMTCDVKIIDLDVAALRESL
jgi:hypothetical protein